MFQLYDLPSLTSFGRPLLVRPRQEESYRLDLVLNRVIRFISQMNNRKKKFTVASLAITFVILLGVAFGQTSPTPSNLPDWSGAWSMVGGTVFDRSTQTGEGGSV